MARPQTTTEHAGFFHRVRVRFFGEPDPVANQLRDLERQGTLGAHVAHILAYLLILLFSLGSLVALGGDALQHAIAGWQRGTLDIPALIALGVTTLLVPAMDAAMLYAASMLRLLASRRADASEMRLHRWVIVGVSIVEAATYTYMSWRYEQPADAIAWGLIVARALASPLLAIYLSMARPLPITPRDILYQVEMATGLGVIRDAVRIANDQDASLARKMALYGASAVMAPGDRERLNNMIVVMNSQESEAAAAAAPSYPNDPHRMTQEQSDEPALEPPEETSDDEPPDGSDPAASHIQRKEPSRQTTPALVTASYDLDAGDNSSNGHRPSNITRIRGARKGRKRTVREGLTVRQLAQRKAAYSILDAQPKISQRKLAAALRERGLGCGPTQAKRYKEMWISRNAQRASLEQTTAAAEG